MLYTYIKPSRTLYMQICIKLEPYIQIICTNMCTMKTYILIRLWLVGWYLLLYCTEIIITNHTSLYPTFDTSKFTKSTIEQSAHKTQSKSAASSNTNNICDVVKHKQLQYIRRLRRRSSWAIFAVYTQHNTIYYVRVIILSAHPSFGLCIQVRRISLSLGLR